MTTIDSKRLRFSDCLTMYLNALNTALMKGLEAERCYHFQSEALKAVFMLPPLQLYEMQAMAGGQVLWKHGCCCVRGLCGIVLHIDINLPPPVFPQQCNPVEGKRKVNSIDVLLFLKENKKSPAFLAFNKWLAGLPSFSCYYFITF